MGNLVQTRSDIVLLAKVFDFLSSLDERQIGDLLAGDVQLSLQSPMENKLEDFVDELKGKLNALLEVKSEPAPAPEPAPVQKKARKPRQPKAQPVEKPVEKPVVKPSKPAKSATDYEALAEQVKKMSAEEINDFFDNGGLRVSVIKSLANRQFGVQNTRPMNTEEAKRAIITAVHG